MLKISPFSVGGSCSFLSSGSTGSVPSENSTETALKPSGAVVPLLGTIFLITVGFWGSYLRGSSSPTIPISYSSFSSLTLAIVDLEKLALLSNPPMILAYH